MHRKRNRHGAAPRPGAALALAIASALLAPGAGAAALPHPGAAALRAELQSFLPKPAKLPQSPAATLVVTSCLDDGGAGTLRSVVAVAGEGDSVDLSALSCSTITLAQGAVPVLLNDLALAGPADHDLAVDGAGADRVFLHPGGGTLALSRLSVRNGASRASGNHVTGGGCIASAGYVRLDHSRVEQCYAAGEGVYGGGVFAYGLLMYTSVLSANDGRGVDPGVGTAVFGGGAYVSFLRIVDSTVSGNRADFDAASASHYETGGGLFSNVGGVIERSTIDDNYSAGLGGGVAVFGGYLDVVDSTISANTARSASGGGLDLRIFAGGRIANTTITGNRANAGGGVYLRGQPAGVVLQSAIVSGNAAEQGGNDIGAIAPTALSGANNLVGSAGARVALPDATLHADPLLLPLADNGGPTRTHALAARSPALDAGNNVLGLLVDQRGAARVTGSRPDIGAFEGFIAAPPPLPAPLGSRAVLGALAAALALAGAIRLRRLRAKRR